MRFHGNRRINVSGNDRRIRAYLSLGSICASTLSISLFQHTYTCVTKQAQSVLYSCRILLFILQAKLEIFHKTSHIFNFFLSFENACLKVTDEQSNTLWDINLVIWSHFYFRENINTQMPQHPTLTPPRWPNLHINCNLQFSKRLLKRSWN